MKVKSTEKEEEADDQVQEGDMVDINSIIEGTVKFRDGKKVNISAIV